MLNKIKNNKLDLSKQLKIYQSGDISALQGDKNKKRNYYRLRVGTYRVIFEWKDNDIIIDVTEVNNRGEIYKKY